MRGHERKAGEIICDFLNRISKMQLRHLVISSIRHVIWQNNFIQRRIRDKLATQHAKVEVIKMQWQKVLFEIFLRAT
jgi:predicted XRE-type DNA-binding protein